MITTTCLLAMLYAPAPSAGAGLATWYNQGPTTASGVRFHPARLTCAHRSLPFGTRVRLTAGTRSVVVTVTDRGPWGRRFTWYLSPAAFRRLAPLSCGVVRVRAKVLSTPRGGRHAR